MDKTVDSYGQFMYVNDWLEGIATSIEGEFVYQVYRGYEGVSYVLQLSEYTRIVYVRTISSYS